MMTDDENLQTGRSWLTQAASAMLAGHDAPPAEAGYAVSYAHAAAAIGSGYVHLAHATWAIEVLAESSKVSELRDDEPAEVIEPDVPPGTDPTKLPPFLARRCRSKTDEAVATAGSLADRLIAAANFVYGNDTGNVLDAPTGHGLAAVVRTLADGPLIQTEWAAAQLRKLAFELEIAGVDRG